MLRLRDAAFIAALVVVPAVASGCGGDGRAAPSGAPAPLSSRVATSGPVPRMRPADLRRPIATYRRHVRRTLSTMLGDVDLLRVALCAGDRRAARAAWLAADERYEEIGAAYGAFGALDATINGRGGVLHAVERSLWAPHGSLDAAARAVPSLDAAVRRLRRRVGTIAIDPLDYVLRAHEVLEDTLHLRLTGRTSPWSGSALVALRGNLRGTRVVLRSVRPLLLRRNRLVVAGADRALGQLARALRESQSAGRLPRWDALPLRQRERLAGLTAAATERVAFVPELLDPRPPRPPQSAFGTETRP